MSKKYSNSRREFLIRSASAVPALAVCGLALSAQAPAADAAEAKNRDRREESQSQTARDYQPSFFNQDEYEFIKAAVSRLIPKDNLGPGALEAGVPEFIDRQLQTPYGVGANWYMQGPFNPNAEPSLGYQLPLKPQDVYRLGIAEAEAFANNQHGASFAKITGAQQDALLELMESGKARFEKVPSNVFFGILLQNTREGFFSDPVHGGNQGLVGWKLVGFPGARADFMDWVERGERYPFPPVSIMGERG